MRQKEREFYVCVRSLREVKKGIHFGTITVVLVCVATTCSYISGKVLNYRVVGSDMLFFANNKECDFHPHFS